MANKKINQLVLKTTIQPTDLFPLGDATTGQLFKKTVAELQAAIGGAVISVNGLVGTVVLDTDDIAELATPTNRYFTEARARAAISLTTTGSSGASTYSSSTGVLNVPTYTLAGLGGIGASFLSGGTGITYNSGTGVISYSGTVYTDASIRALLSAGTGLSYNSSTGAFSYSGTIYTDSSIRGLISLTTNGSSGAATYNNTTGVLNIPTYTLAGLGGISLTALSGTAPITYNSSTGAIGITQASTSTNGFLSSTDWNIFNGKQSALTLGNVSEVVSNVLMFPDGGTNKTIGNLTIQVVQAGSTTSGFLSTTDWNTFNNKQGTITLTTTGTSGAATLSSGTLNIPQYQAALTNPVTGTGTAGHVAYFNGSGSIAGSANHFWDNTNGRLGIGTATPTNPLHISRAGTNLIKIQNTSSGLDVGLELINTAVTSYMGANATEAFIYTASNHPIIFYTNTVARMVINTVGSVGVGTNTPFSVNGVNLEISSSSAFPSRLILTNTSGKQYFFQNQADGNLIIYDNTAGSERFRITNNGEFAFTAVSGYALLRTNAEANSLVLIANTSLVDNKPRIEINGSVTSQADSLFIRSANLVFTNSSASTEYMRFTVNGNLLLGTTTNNGERLYVSGSIRATGSITANSDVRLKKNIERIENALEKVEQISGYTYNTIYDEDRHAGVIAQEIDKVLPEIVNKGNDGLMGVEYGNISALLIEAIKDLKAKNEKLEAIVEGLRK